jgi:hypothetical protein
MSIKTVLYTFGVIMLVALGLQAISYGAAMVSAPSDASVYGGIAVIFFTIVALVYGITSYIGYVCKLFVKPKETKTKEQKENQ